jgi:hypothetical protein
VTKISIDDLDGISRLYGVRRESVRLETVPHERGQISFHSSRVLHGSVPNKSDQVRQTLIVALQDRDNHYVKPTTAEDIRLAAFCLNDLVGATDGVVPDYGCDDFYPTIYSAEQPMPSHASYRERLSS